MKESVYQTYCPGCGIGCGLYIRKDDKGNLSIDYMKSSPANLGKLCRFGVTLAHHYSEIKTTVTGSEADVEDAIKAAEQRIQSSDSIAMLSVGNTCNEEHMAFTRIADTLDTKVHTGLSIYNELASHCHGYLAGMPFAEMEKAKKIALFVDPYVQYPLIVRRLLIAKNNGAKILSVGTKKLNLADENLPLEPDEYETLEIDNESLIIADIHPNSDDDHIKRLIALAQETGAKIHFLRPFINGAGASLIEKEKIGNMSLAQIMEDIEAGNIRTLVTLDSDPVELLPDAEAAVETLKKLDNLIVISSRKSPVTKLADIVIATEPVYMKAGTFISVEGRVQENSGEGVDGIDAMSLLNGELGGKTFDYQQMHYRVKKCVENAEKEMAGHTDNKASDCVSDVKEVSRSVPEDMYELSYLYNPFMWFDQKDDNDFVIIDRKLVKELGLKKGGMVLLSSEKGKIRLRYMLSDLPEGLVLTAKKLPIATGAITNVSMEGC